MPTVELPPATPLTSQVTAVFVLPLTVALNCCVVWVWRVALVGEMETLTGVGAALAEVEKVATTADQAALALRVKLPA